MIKRRDISRIQQATIGAALFVLISASLVSYVSGVLTKDQAASALFLQLENEANLRARTLSNITDQLATDIRFLSKTPPVSGIDRAIKNGGWDAVGDSTLEDWKYRLETIFQAYVEAHPTIAQARLISALEHGSELVRVDRNAGLVMPVDARFLQNKGAERYFIEGLKLAYEEVYFSDITLNREQGVIQEPYVPMLRTVTPVVGDDNERYGVMVINKDVSAVLEALAPKANSDLSVYVTGPDGGYILHPDSTLNFGAEFGRSRHWSQDFVLSDLNNTASRHFQTVSGVTQLVARSEVRIGSSSEPLFVWVAMPVSTIAGAVSTARWQAFGGTLLLGLLGASLLLIFLRQKMAIEQQQRRLAAIVEGAQDAIVGHDLAGNIITWNASAGGLFGYDESEVVGRDIVDLLFPRAYQDSERSIIAKVLDGEHIPHYQAQVLDRTGKALDVSVAVSVVLSEKEQIVGLSRSFRDISAQIEAQEQVKALNQNLEEKVLSRTLELNRSSEQTLAILEAAPNPIITFNFDNGISTCNSAFEALFLLPKAQVLGMPVRKLIKKDDLHLFERAVERTRNAGAPDRKQEGVELHVVASNGTRFSCYMGLGLALIEQQEFWVGIFTDLTELNRQKGELKEAMYNLSMAAEVAGLGIWVWRLEEDAVAWDSRMYEIYELSESERPMDLDRWEEKIHPDDRAETMALMKGLLRQDTTANHEFRIISKAGTNRHIQAAAYVERDDAGQPTRVVGVNKDITAQRNLEKELEGSKQIALQASSAKSSFLANMSHEIRTPMNAVIGMLQLLDQTQMGATQRDYLGNAMSAAKSLLWLLNDILDYSKIESGNMQLDHHGFELDQLMQDLAVVISGLAKDKHIEILFDVDHLAPACLDGDEMRLKQVLINLASNAVKFTSEGQVVITVELVSKAVSKVRLLFSVSDSGIGISDQQLGRIFKGFSQAEASTTRKYGGTGLGLVISSRLVALMGGEIQVRSVLGVGSRFEFSLDLDYDPSASERYVQRMGAEHPLKALVVDDNDTSVSVHTRMLASLGWEVEGASSGQEAIDKALQADKEHRFDVLLLDWRMPVLDGRGTIEKLAELIPEHRFPAVVVMTAYGTENMLEETDPAFRLVSRVLSKPATLAQVYRAVMSSLGREQSSAVAEPSLFKGKALSSIRILVAEDNHLNQQVVKTMLENSGALVDIVSDGGEAIEYLTGPGAELPDIVLMDIQMPDMDGLEATRRVRAFPSCANIPILAMTANVSAEDRSNCMDAGMNGHIGKPFDFAELTSTILYWVDAGKRVADEDRAASESESVPMKDSTALIRARFGGNVKPFLPTFGQFAAETERLLLEYDAYRAELDLTQISALLHTVKGMASNLGLPALSEFADTYELLAKLPDSSPDRDYILTSAFRLELGEVIASARNVVETLLREEFYDDHIDGA